MSRPNSGKPVTLPEFVLPTSAGDTTPVPAAGPPTPVPPLPALLTDGPSICSLRQAFKRRWLLAVAFSTLLGAAVGAALWVAFPAKYTAEAIISVNRPPRKAFQDSEEMVEPQDYMRTQAALLKSPLILSAALRQLKSADLPAVLDQVTWLKDMLTVDFKTGQSVIRVVASGDDAGVVAAAVNAVVKAYAQDQSNRRQEYLQKLKDAYAKSEESLRKKREALMGLEDPKIVLLERDWQLARFDLKKAEAEMVVLKQRENTIAAMPAPESAIEEYLRRDEAGQVHLREIAKIDQDIAQIVKLSALGLADPMVRAKLRQRDQLLKKVASQRSEAIPLVEQQVRDKAMEDNRLAMGRSQERIAALREVVKAMESEGDRLGGFGRGETPQMRALRDDINAKLEVQNRISQEIQVVEMEGHPNANVTPTWVVSLGEAEAPTDKVRGRQIKIAGVGAGSFFVLGLVGVSWLEWRKRFVASTLEISQGLGIPLVGAVPFLPARARRAAVTGATSPRNAFWQGRLTEAVDALRTLLLRTAGDGPKVVMITSALGGEGKTSLAGQLAVSLARAWRKTLLIDGDVRQPAAHQLFNLPVEPGLCEVLRGEMESGDVVQATSVTRLWLMPSGRWDAHAVQALAQEGTGTLFKELKDQYDFIILDSSPVLPVADALVLGQHVDAVLLAVRCGSSRLPAVYAAHRRLSQMGIPVLGAAVVAGNGAFHGLEVSYPRAISR